MAREKSRYTKENNVERQGSRSKMITELVQKMKPQKKPKIMDAASLPHAPDPDHMHASI